jgi:ABC-type transport system substrate-binding protein
VRASAVLLFVRCFSEMRAAWAAVLAAVLLSMGAPSAGVGAASLRGTPAAAPFAQAWASVPASAAARKARNIVVFGASGDVPGFNANLNCCISGSGPFIAGSEALRGAFIQNGSGTWERDLVSDARATKTSLSYTISPKAFWYWGGRKVPVTYKDFVYTLQQLDDPNNDVALRAGYANLDPTRFTHRGLRQVTLFWRTTNCSDAYPCGPFANWQELFSASPGLYPSFALTGADFDKIWTSCICGTDGKPVSDGPFYLANYTPGQGTTLKANPYWRGSKPALAEIDFNLFRDFVTQIEAMRQGSIDATTSPLTPDLVPVRTPGIVLQATPAQTFEHLELREGNVAGGPTVNKGSSNALLLAPWMRKAIALGIDRARMIAAVFGDLARYVRPADSALFLPTHAGYQPDFRRWEYDPKRALAILKAHCDPGSGPSAPDPANTKIWHCAGLPATFRWAWTAGNPFRTTAEQLAKAQLRAIGIAIVERPLPPNVIFSPTGLPSGDFDISEFAWGTTGDPGDNANVYRCRGNQNYTGFCSAKVDALLKAADSEVNSAKRILDFDAADEALAAAIPVIPLWFPPGALFRKSGLLGIDPGAVFGRVERWHWK